MSCCKNFAAVLAVDNVMWVYVRQTAVLYMVTVFYTVTNYNSTDWRTGVVMYRIILSIESSRHTGKGRKNKRWDRQTDRQTEREPASWPLQCVRRQHVNYSARRQTDQRSVLIRRCSAHQQFMLMSVRVCKGVAEGGAERVASAGRVQGVGYNTAHTRHDRSTPSDTARSAATSIRLTSDDIHNWNNVGPKQKFNIGTDWQKLWNVTDQSVQRRAGSSLTMNTVGAAASSAGAYMYMLWRLRWSSG